ncbi:hypothetical protein [Methylorubrum sp. SB2]|uniref:hypothetical protein n=1 Tax=Methylorubrum subtropicum TaxID=3138812 RepID=UPI00313BD3CC
MATATVYLTPDAEAYLRLYKPSTYGIALPPAVAKELVEAGFVEWLPGPAWGGTLYGLTEAGAIFQDEQLGGQHADR